MTVLRLGLIVIALCLGAAAQAANSEIEWTRWSAAALAKAKAEKRFVILDLEAVWCHWCHVMEQTTYRDPKVVDLLQSKYLPIRVDQDANPDLSARYGDWGWPATIIFSPDGQELVKRRGYIAPENMASLLQAVIDDPTPGPSVTANQDVVPAASSTLTTAVVAQLKQTWATAYDADNGGWGRLHKFIDPDAMDWALRQSERGDKDAIRMARQTLDAAVALIDPVWGGVYQYSDKQDWSSPHYEKIMWYQANGLRQYASAYAVFSEPSYLRAADDIYRYLSTKLLSPEGAFYPTQDADVDHATPGKAFYALQAAERDALGRQPRIDSNLYTRENGWAVSGLVAYANVADKHEALSMALRAAEWIVGHRRRADGRYSHGADDRGGPFLGDQIAFGAAALDLYAATGERKWLAIARDAAASLADFRDPKGGYYTSMTAEAESGGLATPHKAIEEQVFAARFANRAARYLGDSQFKSLAEHAVRYLASESIVASGRAAPGALLADDELSQEPTHITVVGHKDDADAIGLHTAARKYPNMNKRIDWWDVREGPLSNPDVTYPELDRPAAFACSNRLCSLPAFSVEELQGVIMQMSHRDGASLAR
ncbi:MAG: DUF255 domain-containing protein [Hyphomicrobium sp.]